MVNCDGLYNKDFFGDKLNEDHFSKKKLSYKLIKNGTILPYFDFNSTLFGGIINSSGKFIEGSLVHRGVGGAYEMSHIQNNPSTVIYLGTLSHIWGHCLTDNLKRLWFFKSPEYKKNFSNCPIVYTYTLNDFPESFLNLLKILDVDFEKFQLIDTPTKFKKIIMPDESFFLSKSGKNKEIPIDGTLDNFRGNDRSFFTKEYLEIIEQIRHYAMKNYSPLSQKKFYFFHGKGQFGEEFLAEYFKSKGYDMIKPENLSLDEQLNILSNCESFASLIGSISHNIIFLRDKSNVILMPRRASYLNIYQQALNQLHDLDIYYIDIALSLFAKDWGGMFCYTISENLLKYFGDNNIEDFIDQNVEIFKIYSLVSRQMNRGKINPNEEKYLKEFLLDFMNKVRQRRTEKNK